MNKILTFLFVTLCSTGMYAQSSFQEPEDPTPTDASTWQAVKSVKAGWGNIDTRYSRSMPASVSTKAVTLTAWKGERVNAQAVLSTPVKVRDLRVKTNAFRTGKKVIDESHVTAYFVSYTMGNSMQGRQDSTLCADLLLPAERMEVSACTSRPIWLEISVPGDAKPGTYASSLEIEADGKVFQLPIRLTVQDRTLPPAREWSYHLDLWQNPYAVARYYGVPLWSKAHFDAMRPLMTELASAGQKVITASIIQHPWNSQTYDPFESMIGKMKQIDGSWKYDYTVFDRWVEFMMDCGIDRQIACYTLVPWSYTFDYYDCATHSTKTVACRPKEKAYRDLILPFLRDFARHLKEKGWWERTCIAMDERPMEDMQAAWDVVMEADPGYRIEGAADYEMHTDVGDKMHDLSILYRHSQIPEDVLKRRKEKGQFITFYTCCVPLQPNTFTFSDPAESAFLGFHALACGYDGYLRWAFNSWPANPRIDSRFSGWLSGDTFLVYPEGKSIRWQRLIEGIQAYEKVKALRQSASPAEQVQLDRMLEPFKTNEYPASLKAHTVVNAAHALIDKLSK